MKLLVHVMPWFGDGNIHRNVGYQSNLASVVSNQLDVLQTVRVFGLQCQGAIMTYQGPGAVFNHQTMLEWATQTNARGMLYCLLLDPWIAKIGSPGNATPMAQNVINALNDPTVQNTLNLPNYVPEKFVLDFNTAGRPPVFDFATAVAPSFPTLNFLYQNQGFAWPSIDMTLADPATRNQHSVTNLQHQHNNPCMRVCAVMLGFRDGGQPTPVGVSQASWTGTRDYNTSVWGGQPARVLDSNGGKLFCDYFATVPSCAPYLGLVTWNDYDEGTDCEAFYAALAGIRIGS